MRSGFIEKTQTRNTMVKLGYMGLIPFLFGLLLSLTDSQLFSLSGETLFIIYSVVILSFLSGILWGNGIENFENQSSNKALILILGYIAVWRAERSMREENQSEGPDGYFDMRTRLTSSVVLMHGIVMLT
ncbi:DUF3429 domain-containing protein [Vibrio sp. 99-70-13A1]|uniref:DUF3429 domain-containing protein n=1 Tax=Vibrio sp. 99-70-13A1 TaxID=2607601 RepID=UPI0014937633|nr:DUF3429 domain-containing protein [Vibrio sp. 99-70-13A1]NOH97363.1 DUF3429 domain-containing protein [Vibrio sp. 99-70-13A1]